MHQLIPKTWFISPSERPGVLLSVGLQSVGHDWATEKHSPLVTISLISRSVSRFLLCKKVHVYHFWNFYLFIILGWVLVAVRGLCLVVAVHGLCLVKWAGATLQVQCMGFSLQQLLLLWSTGSRYWASVVVAYGLSCPVACGIFPDQGWKKCPLLWQADS